MTTEPMICRVGR